MVLLAGCQTSANTKRTGAIGAGGLGGAAAGYAIADIAGESDENKALWAAGSGLAGAVLTNEILGRDEGVYAEGFKQGYIEGQVDAIKRQYWMQQEVAGWTGTVGVTSEPRPATEYYTLPGVTTTADGVEREEHNVVVPIMR